MATTNKLDRILARAEKRGITAVKPATGKEPGPFAILVTRHYYGVDDVTAPLYDERGREPEIFASYEEAKARVHEMDAAVYYLSHNESGRPIYTIIAL